MTSEPAPAERETVSIGDDDVDDAIATCGGDPRAAIKALLVGNLFLEQMLDLAKQEASWGYVRGRPSRRVRDAAEG